MGFRSEQFKMHIVRIGGFHTLSCFIAAFGKLWGDGGLRDLLVDSDVYVGSTADLMLAGKQFHHAVSFFDWCEKENVNGIAPKFWKSLTKTQTSFDKDQGSCLAMMKKAETTCNTFYLCFSSSRNGKKLSCQHLPTGLCYLMQFNSCF